MKLTAPTYRSVCDDMSALRYVTAHCRGWTAIVNDDLIWRALLCGAIVVMAIAVVLGLGCAWLLHAFGFIRDQLINESLQMGCVLGLLVGGIAASLLTTMLDSSVAMVFVSFAENPSALQVHDMTSQLLPPFPSSVLIKCCVCRPTMVTCTIT